MGVKLVARRALGEDARGYHCILLHFSSRTLHTTPLSQGNLILLLHISEQNDFGPLSHAELQ